MDIIHIIQPALNLDPRNTVAYILEVRQRFLKLKVAILRSDRAHIFFLQRRSQLILILLSELDQLAHGPLERLGDFVSEIGPAEVVRELVFVVSERVHSGSRVLGARIASMLKRFAPAFGFPHQGAVLLNYITKFFLCCGLRTPRAACNVLVVVGVV